VTYPHSDMPESETRGPVSGRYGSGGVSWSWVLVAVLAIAIVVLVGWWLWQGASPASETRSASLGTILEEPETFADDRVVVSGQVERLLTESAMTLGNDFVEAELLVLTPPGAFVGPGGGVVAPGVAVPTGGDGTVAPFLESQFVQITGAVRTFDAQAMTEEYGLVLAPELFDAFEGQPAVITEVFDIAINAPQLAPPVEEGEEVDVAAVVAEPERYAGQTVRVEGGFGEVIADNVFTLTGPEGEDGLLVVGEDTGGFDEVERGRTVRVEGTVLGFDAEALRDAGVELGEDIDAASLEGRLTIIPTVVDVLDEPEAAASPAANGTTEATEATPAVATPQAS
jgi:predicted small integral membrane protein